MMKTTTQWKKTGGGLAALLLSLATALVMMFLPARAAASDWPTTAGDYWELTGVHLKNGGELSYMKFLASEWKADQEFAKSKGWIKGYTIFGNVHNRKGEPDIYLVVWYERMPSGPDGEKRNDEYMAWKKKSDAQMIKESGDRAEFREILGTELLQELKFK